MLKRLTVSNLAVVERAEAVFVPGLNVITGETGAGKSVLMGALSFVLGGRAEPTAVRDGAEEAEVEAEFDDFTLRRTVTRQGRSRAWLNDESIAVAELRDKAFGQVDVHGPTANQRLMEERFQRETLDDYGAISIAAYAEKFRELSELKDEAAKLAALGGEEEADMLSFQVGELDAANLDEEDETLAERHSAAAHAEEIVSNANDVTEILGGDDRSVSAMLSSLQPRLRAMSRQLSDAVEWAAEAEELTVRVQELSRTVADTISRLDFGSENLQSLDDRLTLISKLKRKYLRSVDVSKGEIHALMEVLETKRAKLDAIMHRGERLAELNAKIESMEQAVRAEGEKISAARKKSAARLSRVVTGELRDLGFLQAKFEVAMEPTDPTASGMDRVVYMFEPNPGESARPLADIASSGEIARVMLALKAATVDSVCKARTLVFDELDANIGGEVGRIVGEKLRKVARRHQVIAITHLPQSAAFGERHLKVAKAVSAGRTRTTVTALDDRERVAEIARMLGGEELTSVVRKHAEELLELSR